MGLFRKSAAVEAAPRDRFVRDYDFGAEYTEHLDGVDWVDAPLPSRRHSCWPQTRGVFDREMVERCACGATRFDGGAGVWIDQNSRRRG